MSHCTTPLNFAIPAFTVTMPALISTVDALTVTAALALMVIPDVDKVTALPLPSSTRTAGAAVRSGHQRGDSCPQVAGAGRVGQAGHAHADARQAFRIAVIENRR